MGKYASKVVSQAIAWIGKKESNGTHKDIIDVYNSQKPLPVGYKVKYTDAWCATFVSAVAVKLGYTDIIPCECSCPRMITLFQKKGIWIEDENRTPNPGDIIFYDWEDSGSGDNRGSSEHVGIVEKVSAGKITVIEGNYSNSVKRRTLSVNGRYIRGYGVPRYDVEKVVESVEKPSEPEQPSDPSIIEELAREVIAGKHGSGAARRESLGADYEAVQRRVNEILLGKPKSKTIEELAREVIAGKHGNGAARRESLGDKYEAVQKRVNELLK